MKKTEHLKINTVPEEKQNTQQNESLLFANGIPEESIHNYSSIKHEIV
jgi:hypothetical protein